MGGDVATFEAVGGGPVGVEVDGSDAWTNEVRLHGAGFVRVSDLQEGNVADAFLAGATAGCQRDGQWQHASKREPGRRLSAYEKGRRKCILPFRFLQG